MPMEKFEDAYEHFFEQQDPFMDELRERCSATCRYEMKPEEIRFYASSSDGNNLVLRRMEGEQILTSSYPIEAENEKLWKHDETQKIGLFVGFPDQSGKQQFAPLSRLCKLSLANRTKLTFNADFTSPINKIALASLYEDLICQEKKKQNIQIITVYGKAQAVMTEVYSPIGHDEFFDKIGDNLKQRFGNTVVMKNGYISQKWTRSTWNIGEFQNGGNARKIELGVSAMDSQNGQSSAIIQPCLFSGRKMAPMYFDDTWHSKHMALTDEGISQAIDTVYMELNDNAQKLLDTASITLKGPGVYAKNICEELNKLAKNTSGVLLPAKSITSFVTNVEGLSYIRSNLTVWDIIELLWDIPAATATSENHKDGLMKTVSRVLTLKHEELDKK